MLNDAVNATCRWVDTHEGETGIGIYLLIFFGPVAWQGIDVITHHYPATIWLKAMALLLDWCRPPLQGTSESLTTLVGTLGIE